MNTATKSKPENRGYAVGNFGDFLGLSDAERQLAEMRALLAIRIKTRRQKAKLTQQEFADRLKTTQPRVARMEAGARDVTLDKLLGGFFALGGTLQELTSPRSRRKSRSA